MLQVDQEVVVIVVANPSDQLPTPDITDHANLFWILNDMNPKLVHLKVPELLDLVPDPGRICQEDPESLLPDLVQDLNCPVNLKVDHPASMKTWKLEMS